MSRTREAIALIIVALVAGSGTMVGIAMATYPTGNLHIGPALAWSAGTGACVAVAVSCLRITPTLR